MLTGFRIWFRKRFWISAWWAVNRQKSSKIHNFEHKSDKIELFWYFKSHNYSRQSMKIFKKNTFLKKLGNSWINHLLKKTYTYQSFQCYKLLYLGNIKLSQCSLLLGLSNCCSIYLHEDNGLFGSFSNDCSTKNSEMNK